AETVAVEGVGLGYLGRHAVAVARAAPELVPPVFGFADGMLYRHWLPGGRERAGGSATGGTNGSCAHGAGANGSGAGGTGGDNQAWADGARFLGSVAGSIAGSIAMRKQVLAVPVDRSLVLRGRQPAWEVASRLISRSLGPLALPLRLPVVDPLVRRLLQPAEPSIVDGTTGLDRWILQDDGGVRKVDFAEGPFSHEDLATYDAVFDLAGVAVSSKSSTFARSLRTSYLLTGAAVDAERWMLHRLIHVWNETRLGRMTPATADRISAQVVETYFAERFLDDLPVPTDGPFAALDLDGVLETSPLGFPTTTTAGALALRALRAHHFRLVLVTGRSLSEVVERCDTYGATGGVAEYGSVVYDHGRRSVTELVTHDDQRATEGLRTAATTLAEVEVDHDYRHIVRLFRRGPAGRSGLDGDTARALSVTTAAQEHTRPLLPVLGEMQTDFVPADVDKRRGLTVLLDQLGSPVGSSPASPDGNSPGGNSPGTGRPGGRLAHRLALAVGDSTSDAGFLQLADCAVAPANATLQSDGVEFVPGAYQLGLFQAVTRLLGHRPGSCPTCIGPEHSDGARDLLALLSFQENGGRDAARRLASMAARSWSARRRP
ncbi:MAG TPA: hypothetical protein VHZ02_18640, partial [Acidimicrobiales bacterium]|nr:hypothetical protein [Acidimicrobiales bacterium]